MSSLKSDTEPYDRLPEEAHYSNITDFAIWVLRNPAVSDDQTIYVDTTDPRKSLTRGQVFKHVQELAAGLRHENRGALNGATVCLHVFNNIWYPAMFHGILASGGCYTGTNPAYTSHELEHHLRLTNAKFVITGLQQCEVVLAAADVCDIPSSNIFVIHKDTQPKPSDVRSYREMRTPQHLVPRYEQYLENCLIPAEFQPLGMALLRDPRYRTYLSQDSLQLYNDIRRLMIWQSVHMRRPYTYPLWRDDHDFTVVLVAQTMTRLATIVPEHRLQNISAIETLCDTVMQFFVVESQGAVWRQTTIAPKIVALLRELLSCPDDSEQCCTVQDASQRVVGFDLDHLWSEYPELVIWSFLYGAYAIIGDKVQQTWFLYHCAKGIVRHHDPSIETWSWDTLVNRLQGFFYLRHLHDPEFSALWRRCKDLVPSAINTSS